MIVFRRATQGDVEALSLVAQQTFQEGWADIIGAPSAATYATAFLNPPYLSAELREPGQYIYLAIEDLGNTIAGYLKLDAARAAHPTVSSPHPICLQRLYVTAAARGQGVAEALLAHGESEARSLGGDTLWLECDPRNSRAWRFYEKHGFAETGKTVYHLPDVFNDNVRIMVKRISTP